MVVLSTNGRADRTANSRMARPTWPLRRDPGWCENRHDHYDGHAGTITRLPSACRNPHHAVRTTLPTAWDTGYSFTFFDSQDAWQPLLL